MGGGKQFIIEAPLMSLDTFFLRDKSLRKNTRDERVGQPLLCRCNILNHIHSFLISCFTYNFYLTIAHKVVALKGFLCS